ncbi:MAG: hypothetical protein ABI763_08500, partial [Bacteroidota bacterium]
MDKTSNLLFRKALPGDIPFLVDTIVAAEKSGSEIFSYSTIFELPESEIRKMFVEILAEDVQGQELCISDYIIAEVNGERAGAVAAWIEGEGSQRSSLVKATILNYFFPKESMAKAHQKRKYLDQVHFDPEPGCIVVDIGLTLPEFRGQGILAKMMMEQIRLLRLSNPEAKSSQTHMMKSNLVSFSICEKIGYKLKIEKKCDDP